MWRCCLSLFLTSFFYIKSVKGFGNYHFFSHTNSTFFVGKVTMFKHLTGFAYNPSHVLHKNTVNQNHPENENRIKLSLNRIRQIQADKYVADFTVSYL